MKDLKGIRIYRGRSMAGTFRPGDCLHVTPQPLADICVGDVVIFRNQNNSIDRNESVHRVTARKTGGLITRGDNNSHDDGLLVTPEKLVGKITHFERRGKKYPVCGGAQGMVRARILHSRNFVKKILKLLLKKTYFLLKKSGIVSYLWHPVFKKVHLNTDKGPVVKYVCCDRTAAYWWPDQGCFQCKKPYDLVLRSPGLSNP